MRFPWARCTKRVFTGRQQRNATTTIHPEEQCSFQSPGDKNSTRRRREVDVNKSIFLIAQSMNWIEVNDQNIKRWDGIPRKSGQELEAVASSVWNGNLTFAKVIDEIDDRQKYNLSIHRSTIRFPSWAAMHFLLLVPSLHQLASQHNAHHQMLCAHNQEMCNRLRCLVMDSLICISIRWSLSMWQISPITHWPRVLLLLLIAAALIVHNRRQTMKMAIIMVSGAANRNCWLAARNGYICCWTCNFNPATIVERVYIQALTVDLLNLADLVGLFSLLIY